MTYLSHMLANVSSNDQGIGEGIALRRATSASLFRQYFFLVKPDALPKTAFWNHVSANAKGAYLADNGSKMALYWTPGLFDFRPDRSRSGKNPGKASPGSLKGLARQTDACGSKSGRPARTVVAYCGRHSGSRFQIIGKSSIQLAGDAHF